MGRHHCKVCGKRMAHFMNPDRWRCANEQAHPAILASAAAQEAGRKGGRKKKDMTRNLPKK